METNLRSHSLTVTLPFLVRAQGSVCVWEVKFLRIVKGTQLRQYSNLKGIMRKPSSALQSSNSNTAWWTFPWFAC